QQEGAITAAAAIQQLRSQAELMFSKPSANWINFWVETVRKYVKFMQKYYSLSKLIEILGPGYESEARAFKGADLDTATRWVGTTHGLPRTRDEKRQEMMTLFDKGALDITQPPVRQKVYELFGETGMMQSFNKDATNARLENQQFRTGTGGDGGNMGAGAPYAPPDIHPMPLIEDLAIHLYFHKDQAKSQDFQKWDPAAKQALIEHIMETQEALDEQQMQAQIKSVLAK